MATRSATALPHFDDMQSSWPPPGSRLHFAKAQVRNASFRRVRMPCPWMPAGFTTLRRLRHARADSRALASRSDDPGECSSSLRTLTAEGADGIGEARNRPRSPRCRDHRSVARECVAERPRRGGQDGYGGLLNGNLHSHRVGLLAGRHREAADEIGARVFAALAGYVRGIALVKA
jgi:hypothetical protein